MPADIIPDYTGSTVLRIVNRPDMFLDHDRSCSDLHEPPPEHKCVYVGGYYVNVGSVGQVPFCLQLVLQLFFHEHLRAAQLPQLVIRVVLCQQLPNYAGRILHWEFERRTGDDLSQNVESVNEYILVPSNRKASTAYLYGLHHAGVSELVQNNAVFESLW